MNPSQNLTQENLSNLNPLNMEGNQAISQTLAQGNIGVILSRVLVFAFPLAGLILFVMLVWAGFEMLSGATDKKSMDSGQKRAQSALIGFILLFASYWLVQLLEVVFGLSIL